MLNGAGERQNYSGNVNSFLKFSEKKTTGPGKVGVGTVWSTANTSPARSYSPVNRLNTLKRRGMKSHKFRPEVPAE